MSVKETGVSYYGLNDPERARADFEEMIAHHCNAVVLAVTEFDMDFWYPSVVRIAALAREMGLAVHLDPWGIGKFFGGEQVSLFLQNHADARQVTALTGESVPAACVTTRAFREYFFDFVERLARDTEADGFFWDEPHYQLPRYGTTVPTLTGAGVDWTCRCPVCQAAFQAEYGTEMPKLLTPEVVRFRQDRALGLLVEAAERVKAIRPGVKVTLCVHATKDGYYAAERRGYSDWDRIGREKAFDVFSTTIVAWDRPWSDFVEVTERTMLMARKYGKEAQRWVMTYHRSPQDLGDVGRAVRLYAEAGVDSIFAWTYRGGRGTTLEAPKANAVWEALGQAYAKVRER